jgi:site-specific DNA-cytosine methylase
LVKLLIGGSPCTHWSIAQKNNRETTASGIGWELFKNYLIAREKFQPDYFLYENNKSAAQEIKDAIKESLGAWNGTFFMADTGVRYIEINSALVSAQNRQRFYVHNCGEVGQPADRGILLKDILETGCDMNEKAYCLTASYDGAVGWNTIERKQREMVAEPAQPGKKVYTVSDGQIEIKGKKYQIKLADGQYIIRKLTVTECCRLQTMPDDFCRAVSATQAYKGLGNGWTAEVVRHILWNAFKDIPKDEKIVVCSMYDGIATGRYILDIMGFTNVEYHAYEIDKYAMQIAMSNYPDIIQHGDAFQVREDGWNIGT